MYRTIATMAALTSLLACTLVSPVAAAGPHAISGRVIDRNGEPVDRAIISLNPGNVELVTDREGRFLIDYVRDNEGARQKLLKRTDYSLEVFKPGYHTTSEAFYYKRGAHALATFTLKEETLSIQDDDAALDPELYQDQTHSSGATYEGQ